MIDNHSILIDLVSKLANLQVTERLENECKKFDISHQSLKETFPWFVEKHNDQEYVNHVQLLLYTLGALKETYNIVYDQNNYISKLEKRITDLENKQ